MRFEKRAGNPGRTIGGIGQNRTTGTNGRQPIDGADAIKFSNFCKPVAWQQTFVNGKRPGATMNGTTYSRASESLSPELDASFVEGVSWPIDRASLAALLDMGISPRQIARYFSVTPADVLELLRTVGMNPGGRA